VIDPIFESRPPELTSDLEWMLQSGQATHEMLAEALVQEFYIDAYWIAIVFLDNMPAARSVLLETFSNALLSVYRYRSQIGARAWFFRLLIKALRKELPRISLKRSEDSYTGLDPAAYQSAPSSRFTGEKSVLAAFGDLAVNQRLALFLELILGWPLDEIALALSADPSKVNEWLSQAHHNLSEWMGSKTPPDLQEADRPVWIELLRRSVNHKWPLEPVEEEARARIVAQVLHRKTKRDSLQQRAVSVKEIVFTAMAILVVVGVIWGANRMLPDNESLQTPTESNTRPPAAAFRRRFQNQPTPTPAARLRVPFPTPTSQGLFYELKPGESLSSVAARLGISLKALRDFNRLPASVRPIAGDRIVLPPSSLQSMPMPTPVSPLPEIQPGAPPGSNQQILSALDRRNNTWQTLWMDAEILDYGPPGFVGPPEISRDQLWLSQAQFLDLVGNTAGIPDVVILRNQEGLYVVQPSIGQVWFNTMQSPSSFALLENRPSGLFDALFFRPQDLKADLRVAGSDTIAGRHAWRVDQTDADGNLLSRFWMDTRTGFILRSQSFGGQDHRTVLSEALVTKIDFDVDFPNQSMFNPNLPWRGGYASDYTGAPETGDLSGPTPEPAMGHEPLQYLPALQGFNPGAYPLTFQYPADYIAGDARPRVDVFSGKYYLGNTPFGDPRKLICSRSQDGDWLAYVSQPSRDPGPTTQLRLIDLRNLNQLTPNLPGSFSVTQFAFSPDNRKLAFFGYGSQFNPGGLYLMDLGAGETGKLLTMTSVRSLVWSPDGNSLGMIGLYQDQVQEDVIVLDVRNARISFSQPWMDNNSDLVQAAVNWPMKNWGVNFPAGMGGLQDCVNPPVK
jgi:DNA-directed RNA polymerase specialized sigma24 family protein